MLIREKIELLINNIEDKITDKSKVINFYEITRNISELEKKYQMIILVKKINIKLKKYMKIIKNYYIYMNHINS